jgi:hypothetical protein
VLAAQVRRLGAQPKISKRDNGTTPNIEANLLTQSQSKHLQESIV